MLVLPLKNLQLVPSEKLNTPGNNRAARVVQFVSVIVPAFNAATAIGRCLKALNAQNLESTRSEIIVVDDGSTDRTAEVARSFASIRLICGPHAGAAAARNRGARQARGEILLFTDADCEPAEGWLSAMLAPFADPGVVGAKGVYRTRQRQVIARFVQLEYEEKYARMQRAPAIDFVDTYSAAYRRDIFRANGGFDESFPGASVEDQEFSFRLAEQGYRIVFVPAAAVYHRHVSTLGEYVRRKFRIGYWKVRVHTRHPGKVWQDSHTPPTLKLQVGFVLVALVAAALALFLPTFWFLVAASAVGFAVSALPLMFSVTRRDRAAGLVAPVMIAVRAVALGAGLMAGVGGEFARSTRLKRLIDLLGAATGLILFSPLMLLIALAIKVDSPGPVFFVQVRAGQNGRPFRMFKFRSMANNAEALLDTVVALSHLPPPVFKIPIDPRVTRVGKILRRLSLDELPQFVNVLIGEMSLVGPRPEEMRIVALYDDWHRRRLAMKPGMTGPMQTYGRGTLSLDERVRLELAYLDHYSVWQDFLLLLKTVPAVFGGRGAY